MRLLVGLLAAVCCVFAADIRVGIIGTDTSHVPAFTKLLNGDPSEAGHIAGARVVAAYKAGSPDLPESANRVENFAKEIHEKYGVEIVPDIATLLSKVDAVLIESVDGRPHLAQAKPVIAAKKPFFVDKPLAATYEDAKEIVRLAKAAGVPFFSSSSSRFGAIAKAKTEGMGGVMTWGPGPFEEHHNKLDLSWYAIHPIEMLFALMGRGCETVTRVSGKDEDLITCVWKDGRLGSVRAMRPYGDYGAVIAKGREEIVVHPKPGDAVNYQPLVVEIIKMFQTGKAPVDPDETLEIFGFMDAAQKSKEQGGRPVKISQ
jgi:predicted dehydrogenase